MQITTKIVVNNLKTTTKYYVILPLTYNCNNSCLKIDLSYELTEKITKGKTDSLVKCKHLTQGEDKM